MKKKTVIRKVIYHKIALYTYFSVFYIKNESLKMLDIKIIFIFFYYFKS